MMKNYLFILLAISFPFFIACGESGDQGTELPEVSPPSPDPSLSDYILSADITNKYNANIKIDNENKNITVYLSRNEDKTNVRIKLNLGKGVSMMSPKEVEAEYDLKGIKPEVWLQYDKEIKKYTIKVEEMAVGEIDPTAFGWIKTGEFGSLPDGLEVYKSPSQMQGRDVKAFIAVADIAKGRKFEMLGSADTAGGQTPSQFYDEKDYPVIMNGGYFFYSSNTFKLHHIGFLVQNGIVKQNNETASTRPNMQGNNAIYYPTRAIFGLSKGGSFHADWAYTSNSVTYAYPAPSPILPGISLNGIVTPGEGNPLAKPSASFPIGGWALDIQEAVGAGPLLLRNGKVWDTWFEEIWDRQGGTNAEDYMQRSAIGVTENQKLTLFVCEGRNTSPGISGLSTKNVAEILKDLGCVDAINLDGGGSVCMLINGQNTIVPNGGAANQRSIVTAIGIK